jgi:hypothetical protein
MHPGKTGVPGLEAFYRSPCRFAGAKQHATSAVCSITAVEGAGSTAVLEALPCWQNCRGASPCRHHPSIESQVLMVMCVWGGGGGKSPAAAACGWWGPRAVHSLEASSLHGNMAAHSVCRQQLQHNVMTCTNANVETFAAC